MARIADRLWASRPLTRHGHQPHRARAGNGVEFLDFRDFANGDDARWLDWRASARAGRLQVRRFRDETASDWVLCLDHSGSMATPGPAKWRRAAQVCAAMAFLLLHRGNRVGLAVFSDGLDAWVPPGRGGVHYLRLCRELLDAGEPRGATGSRLAACLARVRRGYSVLVISDFLVPDAMQGELTQCLQAGGEVDAIQVLDAAECALDGEWPDSITDCEHPGDRITPGPGDPRIAGEHLDEHRRRLATFCLQRHIRFSSAQTGDRWQDCVVRHLTRNRSAHA